MSVTSDRRDRAAKVISILADAFPDARVPLDYKNPLELLIATILSAQCTDERVNQVTQRLFMKYPAVRDYAQANLSDLEEDIRSTGFYRNKARNIQKCCRLLIQNFGGVIPASLDQLVTLPGIGRKTANVVLGGAFGIPGIVVDTHVGRVSRRLGLTSQQDPVKAEFDLMDIIPREEWTHFSLLLIYHGRKTCKSRKPLCQTCPLEELCPSTKLFNYPAAK